MFIATEPAGLTNLHDYSFLRIKKHVNLSADHRGSYIFQDWLEK